MEFPAGLKYTEDHEWVSIDGNTATVGITAYAAGELGDIVYVEIETEGETLTAMDVFGSVEAVKTVSDLFMPVAGTISEVNPLLTTKPEVVNEDPYGAGWMIKVEISEAPAGLMDAAAYRASIGK